MEQRRRIKYLVLQAVSIVIFSPVPGFAEVPVIPDLTGAVTKSSHSSAENLDEAPLSLSLSLSLSMSSSMRGKMEKSVSKPDTSRQDQSNVKQEPEGESLIISLSPVLSSLQVQSQAEDKIADFSAQVNGSGEKEFGSRSSLFGDGDLSRQEQTEPVWKKLITGWRGFSQLELADNYANPEHFSKAKLRTELSRTGRFNEYINWKISARFDYDAAYDLSDFYPPAVRRNQRYDFFIRENYVDVSAGDFDFRLGRQHVIWGEMVGLFFADVVSAKDMREFLLPAFDILRIPQWAVRAEYSRNDTHAELLWIPVPTLDESGRPGADFYPAPLRNIASFLPEDRSGRNIGNSNYGFRLSQLINGWDLSAFYYHSLDAAPTFYRVSGPFESLVFQPRHDEIDQVGGTLTKDFGSVVLKGELVYTGGRKFNVSRPSALDGLARQNTLDYALGLDFSLPADTRLNLQFFQRVFFAHDRDSFADSVENGASIFVHAKPWPKWETQVLLVHSLNRSDWMFRPRISWNFEKNWRWALGADVFSGEPTGFFGRFEHNDRVYTEMRYSF
ncbi:hypothetical protein C8R21_101180 [Nitrosospira multiformis]|uniref:Uncharacterized protein n=1 Tax=Nitrosospira multiformis TaxID=1231 RepID=A0A2T5II25_9PROT|nr:DUF1302 family protein [Nitrosospira multiformis]PTQ83486.1 hypothetical protein C8R21_101180 [Nitrosospira multiformis]